MVFLLYFAVVVGVLDLGEGIVVLAVPQGGQEVGGLEGERKAEGKFVAMTADRCPFVLVIGVLFVKKFHFFVEIERKTETE